MQEGLVFGPALLSLRILAGGRPVRVDRDEARLLRVGRILRVRARVGDGDDDGLAEATTSRAN